MSHHNLLFLDTRSGYHNISVISVSALFTFAVFLLGGSWLNDFSVSPIANFDKLFFWLILISVCGYVVGRVRLHGAMRISPTEITQYQIAFPTRVKISEIKSYEIINSLRTVAQNGVTVRVPRLLALVTLHSGKKVPLVISVLEENDREKIVQVLNLVNTRSQLDLGKITQSKNVLPNFWIIFAKAFFYFFCVSAIIPLVIMYGKK